MALCLSLICEVDIVLALCLASSEEVVFGERRVVYSHIVFVSILSGGSLCGKSCVDDIVKILLCEGWDVELSARTSKHIFVFAFDPLFLTLSYIMHCIILFISNIYAWV